MKKKLLTKMAGLGWQILPVLDGMIHQEGRDPWLGVFLWLGVIQTASCLLNRIFLKREFRSQLRIVYELLLLLFYAVVISGILESKNGTAYHNTNWFWQFCTLMAIGYGVITCHEIWILMRLIKQEERQATDRNEW